MGVWVNFDVIQTPKCPQCDSTEKVRGIVYGYITSDWCEENPDLIPGGCIVEANSNNWDCGKCGHGWQDDTMYEVEHSEDETPIDKDETFLDRIEKLLFHKNQVVSTVSFIIVAPVFLFMMALLFISMEIRIFFEDR